MSPPDLMPRLSAAFLLAALCLTSACSGDFADQNSEGGAGSAGTQTGIAGGDGGAAKGCSSELQVFATEVWMPLMATDCLGCHISRGLAPQAGSPFELWDASRAGYMAQNIAMVRSEASKKQDGLSVLLAKPLGQLNHGGGKRIDTSDERYQALVAFVNKLGSFDNSCDLQLSDKLIGSQAVQLTDVQVVRKAALQLAARLPTDAEVTQAQNGQIDAALASIMQAPGFGDWVLRIYDDFFLSIGLNFNNVGIDAYSYDDNIARNSGIGSDGTNFINGYQLYWYASNQPSNVAGVDDHEAVMYGLSTMGLQLARHLATTGGDWRDILNADYLMLSPWTARSLSDDFSYNLLTKTSWKNINDPNEFQPIVVAKPRWPTAGLLTDVGFMTTFSTTITNRNRKRANTIYSLYTGLDILSLGTQPPNLNALLAAAANNPNSPPPFMSNKECVSCHTLIDPLASNFFAYNDNINFRAPDGGFGPYTMFAAGFEGTPQPAGASANPAAWVAHQITSDPRFVTSQLRWWLSALTALAPLGDPLTNSLDPAADLAAKVYQESVFSQIGAAFVASGYNIQTLIAGLIKSSYYRTIDVNAGTDGSDQAMIDSVVSYRWVGADAINNKLLATLGTTWRSADTQWNHWGFLNQPLVREFESTLGSIDPSNNVTQANFSPTGLMVRVATTMASKVSCQAVAADFSKPASLRTLFSGIEVTTTPQSPTGIAAIQANITQLIERVTGLSGSDLAGEAADAYQLFTTAYDNVRTTNDTSLPSACTSGSIVSDPSFTLKAWLATLAYIVADPKVVME